MLQLTFDDISHSGLEMSSDIFQRVGKKQAERVFFPAQPVFCHLIPSPAGISTIRDLLCSGEGQG
jgi:hypothetical protein